MKKHYMTLSTKDKYFLRDNNGQIKTVLYLQPFKSMKTYIIPGRAIV